MCADMLGEGRHAARFLKLLMLGIAMIGEGEDTYPASGHKEAAHFDIARIHELDKVFHYDIHAVFMEISMIAE